MVRRVGHFIAVAMLCGLSAVSAEAISRVENTVIIKDPSQPVLHVISVFKDVNQAQIEVGIPVWSLGHYEVRDYARNISRLVFTDQNGGPLDHRMLKDNLWMVESNGAAGLKVEFDYTANSTGIGQSQITPSYAVLNGTNFFFYLNEHTRDIPASVMLKLPGGWRVATGLPSTADP